MTLTEHSSSISSKQLRGQDACGHCQRLGIRLKDLKITTEKEQMAKYARYLFHSAHI